MLYDNLLLDNDYVYSTNYPNLVQPPITNVFTGAVNTIVTSINGQPGPNITISAGAGTGYVFNGTVLQVQNAATVRSSISAAQSGANGDINTLIALTGAAGWAAWTGTPDKTSHATFSGTASVGYSQAEMQAVMNALKNVSEGFMALLATMLAWGGVRP